MACERQIGQQWKGLSCVECKLDSNLRFSLHCYRYMAMRSHVSIYCLLCTKICVNSTLFGILMQKMRELTVAFFWQRLCIIVLTELTTIPSDVMWWWMMWCDVMCVEFSITTSVSLQSPHFCICINELCPVSNVACLAGHIIYICQQGC